TDRIRFRVNGDCRSIVDVLGRRCGAAAWVPAIEPGDWIVIDKCGGGRWINRILWIAAESVHCRAAPSVSFRAHGTEGATRRVPGRKFFRAAPRHELRLFVTEKNIRGDTRRIIALFAARWAYRNLRVNVDAAIELHQDVCRGTVRARDETEVASVRDARNRVRIGITSGNG